VKWQKEIEEILEKHYQGPELAEQLKKANDLIGIATDMNPPGDSYAKVIALMTRRISEDLPSLAAVYAGFMLGVAWERLNAG